MKRIIAFFTILLGLFITAPCFADEQIVAKVGNEEYTELGAAIYTASVTNQAVMVVSDITLTQSGIDAHGANTTPVVIDFQNHKVTQTGADFVIGIQNNAILKNVNMVSGDGGIVVNGNGNTVTFESGTVTVTGGNAVFEVDSGNTLIVKNGTFAMSGPNNVVSANKANVTIQNGSFLNSGKEGIAVSGMGGTKVTISGGSFKCPQSHHVVMVDGSLNISGGTFTSGKVIGVEIKGTAAISGGTFTAYDNAFVAQSNSKVTITGGTFTSKKAHSINLDKGVKATIKGGKFATLRNGGGKVTFNGGTCTQFIENEGTITIKKITVKQVKPVHAMLHCSGKGAKITVTGGTFTSPKGYGYCVDGGGKVSVSKKAAKKFKVKQMVKSGW